MNGELASLVALCLYGNEWLSTRSGPAPELDAENSAFQYVGSWQSRCSERRLFRDRSWEGDGVAAWLRYVEAAGSRRLSLLVGDDAASDGVPRHTAASFANGGRWAIGSDGPRPKIWFSTWSVRDRTDPNSRIWGVEMTGRSIPTAMKPVADLHSSRSDLHVALRAIKGFAETEGLVFWAEWFATADGLLDAGEPEIPYNPDLAPAALPRDSRRLLAAAVQAWVFGGMGSWNDLGFEDGAKQKAHLDLTGRLYAAVLKATADATNATS